MKLEPIAKRVLIALSGRWLSIEAGIVVCCLSCAGCATSAGNATSAGSATSARGAISQQAFGRLQAAVSERNKQRYREAEALLQASGYRLVDDEQVYDATLSSTAKQGAGWACADDNAVGQTMVVRLAPASRTGHPPAAPTELRVLPEDVCPFFRLETYQLGGQLPEANVAHIALIAERLRLARDRDGGLVVVDVSTRVVSRQSVVVEVTRDDKQEPEVDPGSRVWASPLMTGIPLRVILTSTPPPRVEMVVDAEVLDVTVK